ncbi:DUF6547 family protein [Gimesia maris]|uniref:DUF6547 family protein n=1 Tax=Gimesia maris TaxID=122 RepID=UPI00241D4C16|nr:DUF6547 family protein [Gimesia maris]|tara:strand:- start:160 stop:549 length:390 start_codon:yes stop_codon:yes gene_type:complete
MSAPQTALNVYRAIIDEFVSKTRHYGSSSRVADSGLFSNAPDHEKFNNFIETLTPSQRELLSEMLQEERDSAIHDILASLSEWIDCQDVGLTYQGKPMPVDLSGMGLHGDYVGRRDGWEWPSQKESGDS